MKLELRNVLLQLSEFALEVDTSIASARTAIFGPSGAGKTSLLEIIAGLRESRCELICFNGTTFADSSGSLPVRLRKIGYLPQDDSLFPHFDVRRNLLYGRPPASRDPAFAFEHVTRFLQIEGLLHRDVRQLSRGERQRVCAKDLRPAARRGDEGCAVRHRHADEAAGRGPHRVPARDTVVVRVTDDRRGDAQLPRPIDDVVHHDATGMRPPPIPAVP